MKKGNITLIFNHFEFGLDHLGKDVFLIPYHLGKKLGYDVTIVYPRTTTNGDMPDYLNGVRLLPLKYRKQIPLIPFWKHLNFYIYLLRNAGSINLLMRFHLSIHTELISILYKLINNSGKVYVKLDINPDAIDSSYGGELTLKRKIHNLITRLSINKVDLFSCETTSAFQKLKSVNYPELQFGEKLHIIPNGFDEEKLQEININERKYSEKENLIITVGRIGAKEKNTEMFLHSLSKVELKGWQVCFIGNIDSRINKSIESFYKDNPNKLDSVKFIGPIYDKKELWEYYNRAKVFVLTSNWEGYPIVFPEAKRFRNFIISTNIPACLDIIENGRFGVNIPFNDDETLSEVLNNIVTGKQNIDVYQGYNMNELFWETLIKKIEL